MLGLPLRRRCAQSNLSMHLPFPRELVMTQRANSIHPHRSTDRVLLARATVTYLGAMLARTLPRRSSLRTPVVDLTPSLIIPPSLNAGDVCPACTNCSHTDTLCIACRCYANEDDRLPVPVAALTWYAGGSRIARALYRYKCASGRPRHESASALASTLSMWIASHPFRDEAIDAALVVPSTSGTEARHPSRPANGWSAAGSTPAPSPLPRRSQAKPSCCSTTCTRRVRQPSQPQRQSSPPAVGCTESSRSPAA